VRADALARQTVTMKLSDGGSTNSFV